MKLFFVVGRDRFLQSFGHIFKFKKMAACKQLKTKAQTTGHESTSDSNAHVFAIKVSPTQSISGNVASARA